ncbi:TolC family protein [Rugamonas apoptosis]|uniref:TolC family protein n=1 Tax=Rugamonas apoptosis TaxID=2758570 RepID=A0A7W2FAV9_9BURK|nr:TolC family protein [Rugamonas apoptosis]MBA5688313.1 TolC family protein [Rugamonas apoptosis]
MSTLFKPYAGARCPRHGGLRLALLAALCAASTLAFGQAANLTLDEALRLATQASAASRAAQASVQASTEAAARAGQLPDPMLKLGIDNVPLSGPDQFSTTADFMTMRKLGIEQQWVSADKRAARQLRASRAVDAEQGAHLDTVAKVRAEAGKAWLTMLYAQRGLHLTQQLEQETAADLRTVRASHRGAQATAADVLQSQLEQAQARDDMRRAEQELRAARIVLTRWTGVRADAVADTPPPLDSHNTSSSDAQLEQRHPAAIAARRAQALADADAALSVRERSPDWTFEASFSQRGNQYANMFSFGVSIPLTVNRGQRQDREVAEKAAMATKARLQRDDALLELQAQHDTMTLELDSTRQRIAQFDANLLPVAREQAELATAAYRAGAGPLAAVFKARRTLLEKQLQRNELEKQAALAWARLELDLIPTDMAQAAGDAQ